MSLCHQQMPGAIHTAFKLLSLAVARLNLLLDNCLELLTEVGKSQQNCVDLKVWNSTRLARLANRLRGGNVLCRDPEQAMCSPACAAALLQGSLLWLHRPISEIQVGANARYLSRMSLQVLAAAQSALLLYELEVASYTTCEKGAAPAGRLPFACSRHMRGEAQATLLTHLTASCRPPEDASCA